MDVLFQTRKMVDHGSRIKNFIIQQHMVYQQILQLTSNLNLCIIQMTQQCSILQKQYCRDGCCRLFANVAFCDVESNCLGTPTWIIILVPVVLGLAALGLVIVAFIRLKSRNVEDRYVFIKKQQSKITKMQQKQETQRNFKMGIV